MKLYRGLMQACGLLAALLIGELDGGRGVGRIGPLGVRRRGQRVQGAIRRRPEQIQSGQ